MEITEKIENEKKLIQEECRKEVEKVQIIQKNLENNREELENKNK